MKVTIKRIIEPGKLPYFAVYSETECISVHHYKPGVPEDDIYHEGKNLELAKKTADAIEAGEGKIEEVIYQTPDKNPDDIKDVM